MRTNVAEKMLEKICQIAYHVGSNTAMAISRIGAYEDDLEEKAYEMLSLKNE